MSRTSSTLAMAQPRRIPGEDGSPDLDHVLAQAGRRELYGDLAAPRADADDYVSGRPA